MTPLASAILEIRREGESRAIEVVTDPLTIGRAADNVLVLDSPHVSRHHARISGFGNGRTVTDLGSGNGTRVNSVELGPMAARPLGDGDLIEIGEYTLTLRVRSAESVAETTAIQSPTSGLTADTTYVVPATLKLVVTTPAGVSETQLTRDRYTLGRDGGSDIIIDDNAVSRRHAELRRAGHTYEIVDTGSSNGLTLDGERVARRRLMPGDMLKIGTDVTLAYRADHAISETAAPPERISIGTRDKITIGRLSENDIAVGHPAVSRFHARIEREQGRGYVIRDLDSANGTYVNGDRIAPGERRPLQPGDVVRAGAVKLIFSPDGIERIDESRELRLDALHLNQPVANGVNLLQDISLSIQPHEFVAVVGVSGAGKSTLLGALNGFRPARQGAVLINGDDLYRNFDAHRANLGYVPQDDIIHMELTVRSALSYAAQLRLPADTTTAERDARVQEVMVALGLTERANVPVHSLSGGQRKRVSMGVELLTKPGLLFLDEATSGLDPGTELQMMRLLRRLADEGHTILLITHATKNVAFCDQVVFLAKGGNLAWYGPPDAALAYFGVTDFDAIYEKLEEERSPAEWAEQYRASPEYQTHVLTRLRRHYGPDVLSSAPAQTAAPRTAAVTAPLLRSAGRPKVSAIRQFRVLSARYFDIIRRDRTGLILLFAVAPILGAIDLLAYPRDLLDPLTGNADRTMTMMFLGMINAFLVGGLGSVREIVKESAIYRRERMATLKVLPYLLSKVAIAALFALYNAAAFVALKFVAIDMSAVGASGVAALYVTFALAVMSGAMWGLLLSALARREEQVMMLIVLIVVVQIVFSGGILPLKNLGVAGQVLGGVTSSKWVFQAQATALDVKTGDCDGPDLSTCRIPGIERFETNAERQVLVNQLDERFGGVFGQSLTTCWAALAAIAAGLFVIIFVVQKRKDVT